MIAKLWGYNQFVLVLTMTTFIDLGDDIIVSNLCQHLSPLDIFNLSLTCKQLHAYLSSNDAFHALFLHKFGKLTPLNLKEYDWKYLFKIRSDKALNFYTWGSGGHGRLGYLLRDIPAENRSELSFGVHTPTKVPNFDSSVIDQIHAGGYSFQILTNGHIYCIGSGYGGNQVFSTPGPPQFDYVPRIEVGRLVGIAPLPFWNHTSEAGRQGVSRRRADNQNLRLPPEQLTFPPELGRGQIEDSSFVTRMKLPYSWYQEHRRITSISSGRKHFLALDDDGHVFTWDSGNSDWKTGVEVIFPGLHGRIKRVSAGWNLSSCFMTGEGILVWYSRNALTKEDYETGNFTVKAEYLVIPGLKYVVDFITLQDSVLYINQDGDIYRYKINAAAMANPEEEFHDSMKISPLSKFNSWLSKYNKKNKTEASYTKLSGCYQSFAVFTNHEKVLLGKLDTEDELCEPSIPDELQNKGVIQIAIGDYHYLALTDKGKLLSWGLESQNSGCLGLGNLLAISDGSVITENRNHRVSEAHEITKPAAGMWLAVCTSGWHAGGLFIAD